MLVAFVSQRLFGNYTYTIRHGLASGMRRKGGLGFLPVNSGETAETEFLRKLPLAGKVVYDVRRRSFRRTDHALLRPQSEAGVFMGA